MESNSANNHHILHYWIDFGTESIDYSISQAHLHAAFPKIKTIVSPSKIKKGHIQPQAVYLKLFKDEFPAHTIHVCHVSFISTQSKRFMITKYKDQYFLGPDNGLFTMAFDENQTYYKLPVSHFRYDSLREVYIPAVKMLIEGNFEIEQLFEPKEILMKMNTLQPTVTNNSMRLTALYVDTNGNVYFNLDKKTFDEFTMGRAFSLKAYSFKIERILNDYDDVPEGEILALFNYGNMLQIASNASNASAKLGLQTDSMILLEVYP